MDVSCAVVNSSLCSALKFISFFIGHGNLVTNSISIDNKSKRGDEKTVRSLRKIYRGSWGLGHSGNAEGFSEPLTSSGYFLSGEARRGGQSLSWTSRCILGAPVSPAMRWQGWWDGGRGHSKSDHPKTPSPLISSWHHALTQRYVLYLSAKTLCLHMHLNVSWNQIFVWWPMIYLIVTYFSLFFPPHSCNSNSLRVQ